MLENYYVCAFVRERGRGRREQGREIEDQQKRSPEIKLSEQCDDVKSGSVITVLSWRAEMERPAPGGRRCFSWDCWRNLLLPQLNRQSLYVYGSEVAVEKECVRQRERGVFVIHPFSPFRYCMFPLMVFKQYIVMR